MVHLLERDHLPCSNCDDDDEDDDDDADDDDDNYDDEDEGQPVGTGTLLARPLALLPRLRLFISDRSLPFFT